MNAVLITGGSRGIGAETVRAFAEAGYPTAFLYERSDDAARHLARETGACALKADVSQRGQVDTAIGRARAELGPITTLVNNAAISGIQQFQDITEDGWRRMLDVNLTGAFHCTQAVLGDMLARKRGVILNVSSIWGITGASCEVHYSATKAGLIGFTKALAKELGPSGIRVNCVAPGAIATDMNAALSDADRASLLEETPLGRLGTPRDVAQTLLFLASDAAGFITGQVISPNGGMVI